MQKYRTSVGGALSYVLMCVVVVYSLSAEDEGTSAPRHSKTTHLTYVRQNSQINNFSTSYRN